jgi:hypothetical protein
MYGLRTLKKLKTGVLTSSELEPNDTVSTNLKLNEVQPQNLTLDSEAQTETDRNDYTLSTTNAAGTVGSLQSSEYHDNRYSTNYNRLRSSVRAIHPESNLKTGVNTISAKIGINNSEEENLKLPNSTHTESDNLMIVNEPQHHILETNSHLDSELFQFNEATVTEKTLTGVKIKANYNKRSRYPLKVLEPPNKESQEDVTSINMDQVTSKGSDHNINLIDLRDSSSSVTKSWTNNLKLNSSESEPYSYCNSKVTSSSKTIFTEPVAEPDSNTNRDLPSNPDSEIKSVIDHSNENSITPTSSKLNHHNNIINPTGPGSTSTSSTIVEVSSNIQNNNSIPGPISNLKLNQHLSPSKTVIKPLIQMGSYNKSPGKQDQAIPSVKGVVVVKGSLICCPVSAASLTKHDQQHMLLYDLGKRACVLLRVVGKGNVQKVVSVEVNYFYEFKLLQFITSTNNYNASVTVTTPMAGTVPSSSKLNVNKTKFTPQHHVPSQYRLNDGSSVKELPNEESLSLRQDNPDLAKLIESFSHINTYVNVKEIAGLETFIKQQSDESINLIGLVIKVSSVVLPATAIKNRETHTVQVILTDHSSKFIQLNIYDEINSQNCISKGDILFLYGANMKYRGYQSRSVIQLNFSSGFYSNYSFLSCNCCNSQILEKHDNHNYTNHQADQLSILTDKWNNKNFKENPGPGPSAIIKPKIEKYVTSNYFTETLLPLKGRYNCYSNNNDSESKCKFQFDDFGLENLSRAMFTSLNILNVKQEWNYNQDYIIRCQIKDVLSFSFYYVCNAPMGSIGNSISTYSNSLKGKCKAKAIEQFSGEYKCKFGHIAKPNESYNYNNTNNSNSDIVTNTLELGAIMELILSSDPGDPNSDPQVENSAFCIVQATAFTSAISKLIDNDLSLTQQDGQAMEICQERVNKLPNTIVVLRIKKDKEEKCTIQDVINIVTIRKNSQ